MKFTKYRYLRPELLPVDEDSAENFPSNADMRRAGFNPWDEEVWVTRLTKDWNGHPAGSLVISGLAVEGHPFAVETL